MPNHMTHRMRVIGDAEHLRKFVKKYIKVRKLSDGEQYQYLDFELVIPIPEALKKIKIDSRGDIGYEAWYGEKWQEILKYVWVREAEIVERDDLQKFLEKKDPQYKIQAKKVKSNLEKYGAPDLLEWQVRNWGTKWNSYHLHMDLNVGPRDWGSTEIDFTFQTAWSPPEPVLQKLSEQEPDLRFDIVGYEGGMGFACKGSFQGGIGDYDCSHATPELYEEVFKEKPEPQEGEDESED